MKYKAGMKIFLHYFLWDVLKISLAAKVHYCGLDEKSFTYKNSA
jgi:hypothetical protein